MSARPILAGFYPDPSVCRVGEDYYLATSTFEYLPAVALFSSTDLISWTQIGNILDRTDQLELAGGLEGASRGIYAPTLRHHDGLFWMVTTNVNAKDAGHLIVHAEDPAGPWSQPVYTEGAIGIDPDLTWDGSECYLSWKNERPGESGIWQARVDPRSGTLLSPPQSLWAGTGLAHTEGPHLFQRGDWWYLLVAEGGTDRGHAVSVARSLKPTGPFEPCAGNPIFSHRSLDAVQQSTGHPDLVERPDGSWAMVYLAVQVAGAFPRFHVNGRETFLAGVDWADGWPIVVEDRFVVPAPDHSFCEAFSDDDLHPRWISPGAHPGLFAHSGPSGVRLDRGREAQSSEALHLLAMRARDARWTASATIASGDVALVVRIDDEHWFAVERVGNAVRARSVVGALDQVLAARDGGEDGTVLALRAVAARGHRHRLGPDRLEAGVIVDGSFILLAAVDGRYVSTEIAGGFTGRVIGVEALGGESIVTAFEYRSCASETGGEPV